MRNEGTDWMGGHRCPWEVFLLQDIKTFKLDSVRISPSPQPGNAYYDMLLRLRVSYTSIILPLPWQILVRKVERL